MIVRPTLGSLPTSRSIRGQPLAIMLLVLACWIGLRASFWSPPTQRNDALVPFAAEDQAFRTEDRDPGGREGLPASRGVHAAQETGGVPGTRFSTNVIRAQVPSRLAFSVPTLSGVLIEALPFARSPSATHKMRSLDRYQEPTPQGAASYSLSLEPAPAGDPRRFSIDGWLFLREGGVADAGAGPLAPTYGRSQFGALLRYELGPRRRLLPQAYLRATGAIDTREADLAAGVSIRPLAALPLRAHVEVRLSRLGERTELRPSAFVTAGLEEALPLGNLVRGYAQAGYVGGEFATPFADGTLVVERDVKRFAGGGVSIGAGAWAGAQEGTERLDIGPTASLDLNVGRGRMRLAADYRFRVAGLATPPSGAALTLSTSF